MLLPKPLILNSRNKKQHQIRVSGESVDSNELHDSESHGEGGAEHASGEIFVH